MGDGLYDAVIQMEGGFYEVFAVTGGTTARYAYIRPRFPAGFFQFLQSFFYRGYRISVVVGIVRVQQLVLLVQCNDFRCGRT